MAMLFLPSSGYATPLVADMSNYRIAMDANFTGSRIFLFGTRNEPGDVVVVIRGPVKNYIMRKKENFAGLWINRNRLKFFNIPAFYAVASSKPLSDIQQTNLFGQLGIGDSNILPLRASDGKNHERYREYSEAFIAQQHTARRYDKDVAPISFMGETLFKTAIDFPDNIPPGNYTAEIYLMQGNDLIGAQTLPIEVVKIGLDAWLYNSAHEHPVLYGIGAILMAAGIGWLAGKAFNKA